MCQYWLRFKLFVGEHKSSIAELWLSCNKKLSDFPASYCVVLLKSSALHHGYYSYALFTLNKKLKKKHRLTEVAVTKGNDWLCLWEWVWYCYTSDVCFLLINSDRHNFFLSESSPDWYNTWSIVGQVIGLSTSLFSDLT